MQHKIEGAQALYPKTVEPFVFDEKENRSVRCQTRTDKEGKYEISLIVTLKEAEKVAQKMRDAYAEKAATTHGWPTGDKTWNPEQSVTDLFERDEQSDCLIIKCVQKTYQDPKTKPKHFDHNVMPLPDDYELTTGSKVNVVVRLFVWKFGKKTGITIQPKAILVREHKERVAGENYAKEFAGDVTPAGAKAAEQVEHFFAAELAAGAEEKLKAPEAPKEEIDDEIPF